MTPEELSSWTGKTETATDQITATPLAALSAMLDRSHPGMSLPSLWHWLYFLPLRAQAEIGPDGHPQRGGFLPPVQLPRRMWAGGRLTFLAPLLADEVISRTSTITSVASKDGRSGALVFVTVRHDISNQNGLAVCEEQDIVYRDEPRPGDPVVAPRLASTRFDWKRAIRPDPVLLFRYSALTFNGHRIHYDRNYAMEVEGYPGLVVHGPLLATLLIEQLDRELPAARVRQFSFKAVRPAFDTAPFFVCGQMQEDGKSVSLWAQDESGALLMEASAQLE